MTDGIKRKKIYKYVEEGKIAFKTGLPLYENPYDPLKKAWNSKWSQWDSGWKAAKWESEAPLRWAEYDKVMDEVRQTLFGEQS
jgi:hypothetical protein